MTVKEKRRVDRQPPNSLKRDLNQAQLIALSNLEKFGWDLKFVRRPTLERAIPFVFDYDRKHYAILKIDGTLDETSRLSVRRSP